MHVMKCDERLFTVWCFSASTNTTFCKVDTHPCKPGIDRVSNDVILRLHDSLVCIYTVLKQFILSRHMYSSVHISLCVSRLRIQQAMLLHFSSFCVVRE